MMKTQCVRLLRLRRLERIRTIAKQTAAREAAEAESTLAQLEALAHRTQRLAAEYTARTEARDGADLQQLGRFAGGLQGVASSTSSDAAKARSLADAKLAQLGLAERRRAAVEDRAIRQSREAAKQNNLPDLCSRKRLGTSLE